MQDKVITRAMRAAFRDMKSDLCVFLVISLMLCIWGWFFKGDLESLSGNLMYTTAGYRGSGYLGGEGLAVILIALFLWFYYLIRLIRVGSFRYRYHKWRVRNEAAEKSDCRNLEMKHYPPEILGQEAWKELERIFWGMSVPGMHPSAAFDGLVPEVVETTKRGVEIHGGVYVLTGDKPERNPLLRLNLCLAKPQFTSIESVTLKKLKSATLIDSGRDEDGLWIVLG